LRVSFLEAALGTKRRIAINDERSLDAVVPAGTENGQILRLRAQGGPGTRGGARGDLLLEVTVEPHPSFTRADNDIRLTLSIGVADAVLGATLPVATLHGPVQLKIPPGSNTDSVLRLRGKGIESPAGVFGDQLVTLKVVLPEPSDAGFAKLVADWARARTPRGSGH
jgi:DnaJ-class molecular chaperone